MRWLRLAVVVLACLLPMPATAHPADEFFQLHQLRLTPAGLDLDLYLFPGPLVARQLWEQADQNGDGSIGDEEGRAYVAALLPQLHLRMEGQVELAWTVRRVEFPASFTPLQVGDEGIRAQLRAAWPAGAVGVRWFELVNDNYAENGRFWFDAPAVDGVRLGRHQSERNQLIVEVTLAEPAPSSENPQVPEAQGGQRGDSGEAARQAREARGPWLQRLDELLRTPALTAQFVGVALSVALVLGALHALTPGHGKTIVAAYLVGSRGTIAHAAFLGGVVTLTHTGSVLLLGLLALVASQLVVPSRLAPLLELASGLLIVALGLRLLWSRIQDRREHRSHDHSHHHHTPDTTGVSWSSLLTLGVSGGLVPCPDAIAILLIAVALQRILLGLLLIVAFSAGLAGVLIAIGVGLVVSKGVLARHMERFEPAAQWLPIVSAVVVTGLGVVVASRGMGGL
ncbi:MAG TPA: sulfite exporter TauE/SafE family protein [Ardenticatenaceae bacterium]|nr:sulfite exporter TauE/SafE family protein [Ardenticatenaceae bacterium]